MLLIQNMWKKSWLKLETRIKKIGNRLVIILPDLVVNNGSLEVEDILEIEVTNSNLTIKNKVE